MQIFRITIFGQSDYLPRVSSYRHIKCMQMRKRVFDYIFAWLACFYLFSFYCSRVSETKDMYLFVCGVYSILLL